MHSNIMRLFSVTLLLIFAHSAFAQMVVKKRAGAGENILFLQELAVLISEQEGSVKIETVLPVDARPDEYKAIELKEGDEILMVNARRIKTVDDLKKIHQELEIDEAVKLGVKRGEEMFIVEFKKIDPENLPQREMRIVKTAEPVKLNTGKGTPGAVTEKVVIGADENIQLIPGTGLLFQETGKEVEITQVMPHMKEQLGDVDIREGDVLRRVNDTDIESYAQLSSTYEKIEVGAEVSFVLQRGEKEITVLFTKPKVQGKITIK